VRIGVIGAGQLGRMLGFAARELGHECRFLDPGANPPAAVAGETVRAGYDDTAAVAALAADCDVLTYEFENVPVDVLRAVEASCPVFPPPAALAHAQDRVREKALFERLGIPLAPYYPVQDRADLDAATSKLGYPLVLKTRRFGYDGKGQAVIRNADDADDAWEALGGRPLVAEAWVPFQCEVSIIGVRARNGETRCWPLTENRHAEGILRTSIAPAGVTGFDETARSYMDRLLRELDYVGVLALELFVSGGSLLANEFAPRVHNSGHWTIEGSSCSQFSNHVRAITGEALGDTDCRGHAGMLNLIGSIPAAVRNPADPRVRVHDYGKAPRPGRKLGHVTVVAEDAGSRNALLDQYRGIVTESSPEVGTVTWPEPGQSR